ncbi:hypothetical protein EV127DRAFT_464324 [Xylaria flabelliformis]|nr:hypothetical protein EV127DRAFT_464324 [Xylaria flabelliformis]
MAMNMRFVELAKQLHPRLQRFFAKYPPNQILPSSTRTNTIADGATPNPFLPHKHPVTGKWHDPEFSLRRQAELVKLAREEGVEELLPFTSKGTEERIRHRVEHGLRVRGTGVGQKVKGHLYERMLATKYVDGEEERSYAGYAQAYTGMEKDIKTPMPPAISRTSAEPTLYEILSLTPKRLEGQASAAQQRVIKQAYHKALLKYHPDKNPRDSPSAPSSSSSSLPSPPNPQNTKSSSNGGRSTATAASSSSSSIPKSQITYTVDQIQHAYSVLADARQRREYDRQLLLLTSSSTTFSTSLSSSSTSEQKHSVSTRFHTGVETVDLDDLGFDERTGVYFGSCRCGNERGFQFTEAQLEEYEDDLVLMVQCLDCSLWMRVLFDAAEESENDQQQQQQQQQQHSSSSSSSSKPHSNPAHRHNPEVTRSVTQK